MDQSYQSKKEAEQTSSRCSSFLCLSPEDHTGRVVETGIVVETSPVKKLQHTNAVLDDDFNEAARPIEIHSSRLPQPPKLMSKLMIKPESIKFKAQLPGPLHQQSTAALLSNAKPYGDAPSQIAQTHRVQNKQASLHGAQNEMMNTDHTGADDRAGGRGPEKLASDASVKDYAQSLVLSNDEHVQYGNKQMLIYEPIEKKRKTVADALAESAAGLIDQQSQNPFLSPQSRQKVSKIEQKQITASTSNSNRKMKSEQKSFRIHSLKSARRLTGAAVDRPTATKFEEPAPQGLQANEATVGAAKPAQGAPVNRAGADKLPEHARLVSSLKQSSVHVFSPAIEEVQSAARPEDKSKFAAQNTAIVKPQFVKLESIDKLSYNEKSSLDQYSGGMASSLLADYQHQQQMMRVSSRAATRKDQSVKVKINEIQKNLQKKRSLNDGGQLPEQQRKSEGAANPGPLKAKTLIKIDAARKQVKTGLETRTRTQQQPQQSWKTQPSHYLNESIMRKRKAMMKQSHWESEHKETIQQPRGQQENDHNMKEQVFKKRFSKDKGSSSKLKLQIEELTDKQQMNENITKKRYPLIIQNDNGKVIKGNFRQPDATDHNTCVKGAIRSARANIKQILQPEASSFMPSQAVARRKEMPLTNESSDYLYHTSPTQAKHANQHKQFKGTFPRKTMISSGKKSSQANVKNAGPDRLFVLDEITPCEQIECGGDEQRKLQKATIGDSRLQAINEDRNSHASDASNANGSMVKTGLKKFLNKITFTRVKNQGSATDTDSKSIFNDHKKRESLPSYSKGKGLFNQNKLALQKQRTNDMLRRRESERKEQEDIYVTPGKPTKLNLSQKQNESDDFSIPSSSFVMSSVKKNNGRFQSRSSASGQLGASIASGKPVSTEHYISASFITRQGSKGVRIFPQRKFQGSSFHQPAASQSHAETAHNIMVALPAKAMQPSATGHEHSDDDFDNDVTICPFSKAPNCHSQQDLTLPDDQHAPNAFSSFRQGSQSNSQSNLTVARPEQQLPSTGQFHQKLENRRESLTQQSLRAKPASQALVSDPGSALRERHPTSAAKSAKKGKTATQSHGDTAHRLSEGKKNVKIVPKGRLSNPNPSRQQAEPHAQRPSSSKVGSAGAATRQSRGSNAAPSSKGQKQIRIQSGAHNLLGSDQQSARASNDNEAYGAVGLHTGGARRSTQLFNTEKKQRQPTSSNTLVNRSQDESLLEPAIIQEGKRSRELTSFDQGPFHLKKSPSANLTSKARDAKESANLSLMNNSGNLHRLSSRKTAFNLPATFSGGVERVSSKMVCSLADLTVEEEPDAEAFISPDQPQKKTQFAAQFPSQKAVFTEQMEHRRLSLLDSAARLSQGAKNHGA